ncbi:MAG: metallophosphoesterase family protein [Alkalispirochaetaceae bacterium]
MIAHLTDIHVGNAGEEPRGVPVRDTFQSVLREIREAQPDLLVVTGDLALNRGNREIYRWVRATLDDSGLTYLVLPGNHDVPEMIAEEFSLSAEVGRNGPRLHRAIDLGGERVILLDTPGGTVEEEDAHWLSEALADSAKGEVLLFMHYPPVPLPIAHMERHYTLQGRELLRDVLERSEPQVALFCGHYHNELSLVGPGYALFLTPSTYFQIAPLKAEFAVDHHLPAWRFIERYEGLLTTGVRYRGS